MTDEPTPPPLRQAAGVAEAFLHAWARPQLDVATWLAGVSPYTAPAYQRQLRSVDPANVPAHRVTGPAVMVRHDEVSAVFDIATDAGVIRVLCLLVDGRWLVASVQPRAPPARLRPPACDLERGCDDRCVTQDANRAHQQHATTRRKPECATTLPRAAAAATRRPTHPPSPAGTHDRPARRQLRVVRRPTGR